MNAFAPIWLLAVTLALAGCSGASAPAASDGAGGEQGAAGEKGAGAGSGGRSGTGTGGRTGSGGVAATVDAATEATGGSGAGAGGGGGDDAPDAAESPEDAAASDGGPALSADAGALVADAAPPTGNACPGYKKGTHTQSGVSAADFCQAYAKACPYATAQRPERYKDQADCLASYGNTTLQARICLAGHLCEAVVSTSAQGKASNCSIASHGPGCRPLGGPVQ